MENLNRWKQLNATIVNCSFYVGHTIDDFIICYYSNEFSGWLEYDINNNELRLVSKEGMLIDMISKDNLTQEYVSKWLINNFKTIVV